MEPNITLGSSAETVNFAKILATVAGDIILDNSGNLVVRL